MIAGCNRGGTMTESGTEKRDYLPESNPVDVMVLQRSDFRKELISNGKLKARSKSVLQFDSGEELIELNVRNGQRVQAGQLIARLKQDKAIKELEQARINLSMAGYELQERLISQGYSLSDTAGIPDDIYEIACIRSGYTMAKSQFDLAELSYRATELRAPFDGVIANLSYRLHEQVRPGVEFCSVIDNSVFEVVFPVLESELTEVALGKEVSVNPFSSDSKITGTITGVNPLVNENGLIQLTATLRQSGQLLDGMNVQVKVENTVHGELVVPKSAVVQRDNQEVLFKYVSGQAYWTYVQTGMENSTSYTVIAHPDKGGTLEPGDTIIISGNLNLAHESEVVIQ